MWYAGIFIGEIDKPLTVFKYTSYAAILLSFVGWHLTLQEIAVAGLLALGAAIIGGVFLIKTGVVKFVQELNNRQNPWNDKIQK